MSRAKKVTVKERRAKLIALCCFIIAVVAIVTALLMSHKRAEAPSNNPYDESSQSTNEDTDGLLDAVNTLPDRSALEFIRSELNGYWVSESQFVGFTDSGFDYGLLNSGFGVLGEIVSSNTVSRESFALTINIPEQPATEMSDGSPARAETVYVDVSTFDMDGRISVKIENLGDGGWHTYDYIGKTLQEAYN